MIHQARNQVSITCVSRWTHRSTRVMSTRPTRSRGEVSTTRVSGWDQVAPPMWSDTTNATKIIDAPADAVILFAPHIGRPLSFAFVYEVQVRYLQSLTRTIEVHNSVFKPVNHKLALYVAVLLMLGLCTVDAGQQLFGQGVNLVVSRFCTGLRATAGVRSIPSARTPGCIQSNHKQQSALS
jgi:hypothetical protein